MEKKGKKITNIAVLGAGIMGPGIAEVYAGGGYNVKLWSRSEETLAKAKTMILGNMATLIEEKMLTKEDADKTMEHITFVTSLQEACTDVELIQETIVEDPEVKEKFYREISKFLAEDTIIATNTSFLDPFPLMEKAAPERSPYFTTAHWYTPAQIVPLVEVARGPQTVDGTLETISEVLHSCGKTPARLEKFVPGYIVNRIQSLLDTEIFYLMDNGICTAEQMDIAVKASFLPRALVLGIVQRFDFGGLTTHAHIMENGSYVRPPVPDHPKSYFDHIDRGERGIKNGKGFYDYGDRTPVELARERDKRLIAILKAAGNPEDHI